ncbi:major facilitator superfamily domain-containing protein [Apiospora marii]|uniref:Major facilitator superfamily domain-containing protein n=1 Tax=Apiospora marii TaxID=335849 RepID=A0ABR1RCM4_9PEZI
MSTSIPEPSSTEPPRSTADLEAGKRNISDSIAKAESSHTKTEEDSNLVDWDGDDDKENPRNWSDGTKMIHVATVSIFVLIANLAATMFAPGVADLAIDFGVTNTIVVLMTVSIYVLGFALGPLILAPLSELYGRLVVYHCCNLGYIGFTFGCAFSTDVAMFLVFRFLAGTMASGPLSVGGGTIADLYPPQLRGKAMSMFSLGPLLGPVIGPIVGGYVAQYIGWRWTFRIILILAGLSAASTALFTRETNSAVLLQRKAAKLRRATGNPQLRPKTAAKQPQQTPREMLLSAVVRPVRLLVLSPIVLIMSLYTGIIFGLVFLLFATIPAIFAPMYGFGKGVSGLCYLGLGIGMALGLVAFSRLSDQMLGRNGAPKPEDRLILMKWLGPICPLGMFLYGWTAYYHVHWLVPILGTFVVGVGALFVTIPGQIYLVDAFGARGAASALAANLLVRCLFGAFLDLAADPLYRRLDVGWGNSVLAFITMAFTPVPWLFHRYGEAMRNRFPVDL